MIWFKNKEERKKDKLYRKIRLLVGKHEIYSRSLLMKRFQISVVMDYRCDGKERVNYQKCIDKLSLDISNFSDKIEIVYKELNECYIELLKLEL